MGENCTALIFVDVAAFRIGLTLAERFDAQIRVNPSRCCFVVDELIMG